MVQDLTEQQILHRMNMLEALIPWERNTDTLASLNRTYQMLLDELVRRDLLKGK